MTTRSQKARIRQRIAAMKGFYIHASVFVIVATSLLITNVLSGKPLWAHWVFLGWGLGVALNGILVFGSAPKTMRQWEEKKMRELLEQEKLDNNRAIGDN